MNDVFSSLAVVLGLSAIAGIGAKALKQPPLVGYVLAGVVIGISGLAQNPALAGLPELLGKIGVTLLLFLAGMELPLSELKRTGKTALVTAGVQMTISSLVGFGLARLLGFTVVEAVYIGVGLAFGSTIMVVKLLSENGDIQSLHGKIAVGYLLVQDFVAIGLLVVLAGVAGGSVTGWQLIWLLAKGIVMVVAAVSLAETVMGKVVDYVARSSELLFIASIGWCLLVAAAVASPAVGFSVEIGGFLAGLSLARATEQAQIIARVRPLRDFFLTWFFVALGATVKIGSLAGAWLPAVVFSTAAMVLTAVVVYTVLVSLGYHRRTAVFTAITVSQISEFSLIVAASGVSAGEIGERVVLVLTLVAMVTMTLSSYLISSSKQIYRLVGDWLWRPSSRASRPSVEAREKLAGHVILFGHNRTGSRVRPVLEKLGFTVMVVDFNPEIIDSLGRSGVKVMYGDVSDHELYEQLDLADSSMVISTVPDVHDNLHLLGSLLGRGKQQLVIVTAADGFDAQRLYEAGADYVLIPNQVGGDYLAGLIEQHAKGWTGKRKISTLGKHLAVRREVLERR